MKAVVPNLFRTGGIVDGEDVNDNLRAIADDVNRNLSRRYTYCTVSIPLDTVTNAMTEAQRSIHFALPSSRTCSIVGVKLSIYATSGVTWTLSESGVGTFNAISLTTAGATTEATAVSSQVTEQSSTATIWVLTGSGASTIARGTLYLTLRFDRFAQTQSLTTYDPAFVDASTSSAGSVLDTQLTAAAAAVTSDAAAVEDIRCECFVARSFATTQRWTMPSGAGRTALGVTASIVATAADAVDIEDQTSTLLTLVATGTGNRVNGTATQANRNDDPTDSTDDTVVTILPTGTVELCYAFFFWS